MKNFISMSRKSFFIAAMAALVGSCATSVILPVPNSADAVRAAEKFPGTTMADLDLGKVNYERHCQKCHGLVDPKDEPEAEWREIVPIMAKKAKIDAATEQSILRYVVVMSAHTPQ
jgi:cytochrome c5